MVHYHIGVLEIAVTSFLQNFFLKVSMYNQNSEDSYQE
jgi:hypothetical protein